MLLTRAETTLVTSRGKGVAPMETYLYERPSGPLSGLTPISAIRVVPVADITWRPQVHQVQAQSELVQVQCELAQARRELAQAPMSLDANGTNGTSGFTGKDVPMRSKRTDVRGVPPRGKPV